MQDELCRMVVGPTQALLLLEKISYTMSKFKLTEIYISRKLRGGGVTLLIDKLLTTSYAIVFQSLVVLQFSVISSIHQFYIAPYVC